MKANNETIAAMLNTGNYNKPRFGGYRKQMIALIEAYMELIVQKGGDILLTARQVLDVLQDEGILSTAGIYLTGANSVGDVLGAKHFKVPMTCIGTTRVYLIPAVKWTAEEIQQFDALTVSERATKLQSLRNELLKTPEGQVREMVASGQQETEEEEAA